MKIRIVVLSLAMAAMAVAEAPLSAGYNYNSVGDGVDTYEGATLDPSLLQKIRLILLREEQNAAASIGRTSTGVSSAYGVPAPVYGAPNYYYRVVGIDLDAIKRAILVAKYDQISYQPGGYNYPSAGVFRPSGSYGVPY